MRAIRGFLLVAYAPHTFYRLLSFLHVVYSTQNADHVSLNILYQASHFPAACDLRLSAGHREDIRASLYFAANYGVLSSTRSFRRALALRPS